VRGQSVEEALKWGASEVGRREGGGARVEGAVNNGAREMG
jgi:hypothetical protein